MNFDRLKNNMFNITTNIMGYSAIWTNSETAQEFTAKVHFKYPTPAEDLAGVEYFPEEPYMEFKQGDFDGLKELVDNNKTETVVIEGRGSFYVRSVNRKYDGDTLICVLADV